MNTLLIYFLFLLGLHSTENPQLTVNIQNIELIKGEIVIGIYNSEVGFLGEKTAVREYKLIVDDTTEELVISDLPTGSYAITLYHDVNSDDVCNLNFLGIPKEPYGFSNNFKPKISAPKFKDCVFKLDKNQTINIKLIG